MLIGSMGKAFPSRQTRCAVSPDPFCGDTPQRPAENERDFLGSHSFPRYALLEGAVFLY